MKLQRYYLPAQVLVGLTAPRDLRTLSSTLWSCIVRPHNCRFFRGAADGTFEAKKGGRSQLGPTQSKLSARFCFDLILLLIFFAAALHSSGVDGGGLGSWIQALTQRCPGPQVEGSGSKLAPLRATRRSQGTIAATLPPSLKLALGTRDKCSGLRERACAASWCCCIPPRQPGHCSSLVTFAQPHFPGHLQRSKQGLEPGGRPIGSSRSQPALAQVSLGISRRQDPVT